MKNTASPKKEMISAMTKLIRVAAGNEPADLVFKNANYLNVFTSRICRADIAVCGGTIAGIGTYSGKTEVDLGDSILVPGLVDSHIHLESALVSPAEFARTVLPHGTTTVITDPHEIANIMGTDGINYMLQATEGLPLDVLIMLPSCVPATPMDESGAVLDAAALEPLYQKERVLGLAEMMNFPGVTGADPGVLEKLCDAANYESPIDGHAPGLSGNGLNAYIAAGVSTDHECSSLSEATEKLERGQFIIIREGTAAHNLEALLPLLSGACADRCLLCSDDRHPEDLLCGHIDAIIRKAAAGGADPIRALKAATINAAVCFGLKDRGAIAPGKLADLLVVDSLEQFTVEKVYKRGTLLYENGSLTAFPTPCVDPELLEKAHHTFHVQKIAAADLCSCEELPVIGLIPGEIVTTNEKTAASIDPEKDILKLAVLERHHNTGHIGLGYLHGYGLKKGAVASSIAHDSHNIIVVGATEEDMAAAVNRVIEINGGIVVAEEGKITGEVNLSIGGIMSEDPVSTVNRNLEEAKKAAFALGVQKGIDPFMTLSFLALPVIPSLKLLTTGMFDVDHWTFISH